MEPASTAVAELVRDTEVSTHDIIVIGASAGALAALETLMHALPGDFPGAIFIVVHISPEAKSEVARILDAAGSLPVVAPLDGDPIVPGTVYVSTPDMHMLIERGRVRIVRGPKENRHRPAIDPLFRSAAWAYGPRVVGIVLTGYLDDGAAGLWAIKSCGGTSIVQDPADAAYPEMPANALLQNDVDHCVPLADMADLLVRLAQESVDVAKTYAKPPSIKTEVETAAMERLNEIEDMDALGKVSPFTCPSCHGALWELSEGNLLRYRCHTGHAFTGKALLDEQSASVEAAVYSALRVMEEKAAALRRLGTEWNGRFPRMEAEYQVRAKEIEASVQVLRALLAKGTL